MKGGIGAVMPKFNLPYTLVDTIAYDPAPEICRWKSPRPRPPKPTRSDGEPAQ